MAGRLVHPLSGGRPGGQRRRPDRHRRQGRGTPGGARPRRGDRRGRRPAQLRPGRRDPHPGPSCSPSAPGPRAGDRGAPHRHRLVVHAAPVVQPGRRLQHWLRGEAPGGTLGRQYADTPCGSTASSATTATPTPCSPGRSPTGRRPWPGCPNSCPLPRTVPAPPWPSYRGGALEISLDSDASSLLLGGCPCRDRRVDPLPTQLTDFSEIGTDTFRRTRSDMERLTADIRRLHPVATPAPGASTWRGAGPAHRRPATRPGWSSWPGPGGHPVHGVGGGLEPRFRARASAGSRIAQSGPGRGRCICAARLMAPRPCIAH